MEPFEIRKKPMEHLIISKWENRIPGLRVGFSSRKEGTSTGHFNSMNLALHVGDREEDVISNRKKIAEAIGFPFEAWTSAEQVHGNNITIVTKTEIGKGRMSREDAIQDSDGILTNIPSVLLTSYYADCVPLYFIDPIQKVVGLAHAGWKGTVLRIGEKMVETMSESFHSKPENILAAIGPSIGQCCYEVNDVVINQLKDSISNIPNDAIMDKKNGHFDLDLKKINKQILIEAGILTKNIEFSTLCTSCETDLFFSHRRDKGKTGRMMSWIGIREVE